MPDRQDDQGTGVAACSKARGSFLPCMTDEGDVSHGSGSAAVLLINMCGCCGCTNQDKARRPWHRCFFLFIVPFCSCHFGRKPALVFVVLVIVTGMVLFQLMLLMEIPYDDSSLLFDNNGATAGFKDAFVEENIDWSVPVSCGYYKCFVRIQSNATVGYLVTPDDDDDEDDENENNGANAISGYHHLRVPYSQTLEAQYMASQYLVHKFHELQDLFLPHEPPHCHVPLQPILQARLNAQANVHHQDEQSLNEDNDGKQQEPQQRQPLPLQKHRFGRTICLQKVRVAPPNSLHFGCLRNKAREAVQKLASFVDTHVLMMEHQPLSNGNDNNGYVSDAILARRTPDKSVAMVVDTDKDPRTLFQVFVDRTRQQVQYQIHVVLAQQPRFAYDYQVLLDTQGNLWQIDVAAPEPTQPKNTAGGDDTSRNHEAMIQNRDLCVKHFRILLQELSTIEARKQREWKLP